MDRYINMINELRSYDISASLKLNAIQGMRISAVYDKGIGVISENELKEINDDLDELWEKIDETM